MPVVVELASLAMMMKVAVITYVRTYGDDGYVRSRLFPVRCGLVPTYVDSHQC